MKNILFKNGLYIILIKGGGTFLTFLLSIVLARSLGSSGYGLYSFALSVLMIISIPIQSGIPILVVRETARAVSENNYPLIGLLRSWSYRLILTYAMVVSVVLICGIVFEGPLIDNHRFFVSLVGLLSVPFIVLTLMQSAIIRGIGSVVVGVIPDGFLRPLLNIILIFGLFSIVGKMEISAMQAIFLYGLSAAGTLFVTYLILKLLTKKVNLDTRSCEKIPKKWQLSLRTLTVVGGAQLLFSYLDILILGFYSEDSEVGVYRVAVQFSIIVGFGLTVLNQMLHPLFSRLYAEKNISALQKLVVNSSLAIFTLAIVPTIIFFLLGEYLLNHIFGLEYKEAAIALKILVLGQLVNAACGSVGALLNMTGHEKDAMAGMLVALLLNIILAFILIPIFGIEGAAMSSAFSLAVWNIILRYFVKKRLAIESSSLLFFLKKSWQVCFK